MQGGVISVVRVGGHKIIEGKGRARREERFIRLGDGETVAGRQEVAFAGSALEAVDLEIDAAVVVHSDGHPLDLAEAGKLFVGGGIGDRECHVDGVVSDPLEGRDGVGEVNAGFRGAEAAIQAVDVGLLKLLLHLVFSLLPVQVLVVAMGSVNSLVDGVVASRCIAAEMVGVVGLYYSLLRIKDNGIPFNPEERAALVREDSPYKNIGTRIVHGLASQVSYQNLMGLNVLTIEVGRHA